MPSKFDEYLNKGGFNDQDKEALKGKEAENVDRNTIESDYQEREGTQLDKNVHGHDSSPEYRPMSDDVKAQADAALETPEEAPEEPKQGIEADYPSTQSKGEEAAPEQEQEQDLDR